MKILDLEQRTDEWLAFHEGKISGAKAKEYSQPRNVLKSDLIEYAESKGYEFPHSITIPSIREKLTQEERDELDFSVQINDSIYKLIAEKIAKPINPNDYPIDNFSMMARGTYLEDEARLKIAEKLGVDIIPGRVWQADFNDEIICSPDGEIEVNGKIKQAVEIKCLDSWKVVKAFYERKPPTEYEPQIRQYFVVNEDLETLYFCVYSDCFAAAPQMELQIFTIHRSDIENEIRQARMIEEQTLKLVNQEVAKLMF